jgi:hypothetical protein
MGSHTVVDTFPVPEFLIQLRDGPGTLIHLVKLLRMGSMRPFHRPIELRSLRRQDKEANPPFLTLLFKLRITLRSPIHWLKSHLRRYSVARLIPKVSQISLVSLVSCQNLRALNRSCSFWDNSGNTCLDSLENFLWLY